MSTSEQTEIERKYDVDAEAVVPDLDGLSSPAGGAAPVLEVARVERSAPAHLRAVYHDTDDHLLLGSRITLRRRTGGHDEGWHLKLPPVAAGSASSGQDSSGREMSSETPQGTGTDHSTAASTSDGSTRGRREVHVPLGSEDEGVPAELLARVEEQLRGRSVAPVIVLETTRMATTLVDAEGDAVAELADDVVTATVPGRDGAEPVVRRWREWEAELAPGVDGPAGDALLDAIEERLLAGGAVPSTSRSKLARGLGAEPA
ncbi:CYTH domain-containing protein [Frigoribacterium sp. VKM Ac-2530]|uniref:CYTH domain-containing protein n=1 Tax=Frigoribacterium sp. VKM Ac-2530 TaxID=2783822 RepID=UPI00188A8F5A|nr:CYTH domain-containing protein [Frigoribacterium sp. VKM Ac-2530]MBF4579758.1 CYTH domain-containing protein [Frigoribacterium sp. VKM Ac-2530]